MLGQVQTGMYQGIKKHEVKSTLEPCVSSQRRRIPRNKGSFGALCNIYSLSNFDNSIMPNIFSSLVWLFGSARLETLNGKNAYFLPVTWKCADDGRMNQVEACVFLGPN